MTKTRSTSLESNPRRWSLSIAQMTLLSLGRKSHLGKRPLKVLHKVLGVLYPYG